jgi:hypothetical protein
MSERRVPTISIGKGVKYARVADRSAAFHQDNEQCNVETSCEFKDGFVLFTATVTTKKGTFTGHSLAKVSGQKKEFEKQETIAVGRALAFAGYLADGAIACAEEMEDVVSAAEVNAVKLKYAKVHADDLIGLDRPQKQQRFSAWCLSVIGEEADYSDPRHWEREWIPMCIDALGGGHDPDVPFEE